MARVDVDASGVLDDIPIPLASPPCRPTRTCRWPSRSPACPAMPISRRARKWRMARRCEPAKIEGVKLVVPQAQSPQIDLAVAAIDGCCRHATARNDGGAGLEHCHSAARECAAGGASPWRAHHCHRPSPCHRKRRIPRQRPCLARARPCSTGDLVSARQFFIKAHGMGLADGAFGAGQRPMTQSCIPAMNVHGMEPDPDKAREWYDRAVAACRGG